MSYKIISTHRPLPLGARKKLKNYNILNEKNPNECNRWTVIEVEEKPEKNLLENYALKIENDEDKEIWESERSTEVFVIFENRVENYSGKELSMDPKEAKEKLKNPEEFKRR